MPAIITHSMWALFRAARVPGQSDGRQQGWRTGVGRRGPPLLVFPPVPRDRACTRQPRELSGAIAGHDGTTLRSAPQVKPLRYPLLKYPR